VGTEVEMSVLAIGFRGVNLKRREGEERTGIGVDWFV
jgi:hypothetical protein